MSDGHHETDSEEVANGSVLLGGNLYGRSEHNYMQALGGLLGQMAAGAEAPAEAGVGAHSGVGRGPCPLTPPAVSRRGRGVAALGACRIPVKCHIQV